MDCWFCVWVKFTHERQVCTCEEKMKLLSPLNNMSRHTDKILPAASFLLVYCYHFVLFSFVAETQKETTTAKTKKTKLHGLSPRANYTDRATTACRQSDCQLLRIKGATWSA
jgi:hypothetical protein